MYLCKRGDNIRLFGVPNEYGPRYGIIINNTPNISIAITDYTSAADITLFNNVPLIQSLLVTNNAVIATPTLSCMPDKLIHVDVSTYFSLDKIPRKCLIRWTDGITYNITTIINNVSVDIDGLPIANSFTFNWNTGEVSASPTESCLPAFR